MNPSLDLRRLPPATIVIGVDPGISGAIAAIDLNTGAVEIIDIPTYPIRDKHGKRKLVPDLDALAAIAKRWPNESAAVAIEKPTAYNQGVVSAATFAANVAACEMAFAAAGIWRRLDCPPATWKAKLKVSRNKQSSVRLAQRLFPHAELGDRKTADRAEALLIAYYGLLRAPDWFIDGARPAA